MLRKPAVCRKSKRVAKLREDEIYWLTKQEVFINAVPTIYQVGGEFFIFISYDKLWQNFFRNFIYISDGWCRNFHTIYMNTYISTYI